MSGETDWLRGWKVHAPEKCAGASCAIHNPSDHNMKGWPRLMRETGLVERLCKHGVGHPDPDSVAWLEAHGPVGARTTWGIHGCCGCCCPAPDGN